MHAISITESKELRWVEHPTPVPQPHEVLIRIHATALNRADLMQRAGLYPPPPGASPIPGLECAGEIAAVGADVRDFSVGDPVCALLAGGGWAGYVASPAQHVLPLPSGLSFEQAAALPEVFATAYLNIVWEAQAKTAETVLVHAGASGVGTATIQLCRWLGLPVMATAGSAAKVRLCESLGAAQAIPYREASFVERIKTTWGGVDVILDPVGGSYLEDNLNSLNQDGRLILIGIMGGRSAPVDLGRMLMKRLRLIGSTLRSRDDAFKARLIHAMRQSIWPAFNCDQRQPELKPVIDRLYPITDIEAACAYLASNASSGKVVIQVR
ncbi:MAG TPA: NAD(P)H-quinone oxidoreductase [Pseudomonadales bacterium]|nr:NAD(P)H-quinone oxidoreductase [Pseudomonadales bacterium]